ncbi:IclR family transcriptional regulator [Gordonia sp. TBRC 11910]|uniref:IclR family transcriptional regulator n=1 Tax=Gordonia asplenii TaxID=2725283 RepID=A0A848L0Q4_9ACTN|nr:IclR family transcriptional regulator [Gordonia asplenii]NMO04474.1 IclR family transcriptional regulator [Gordonia asplenii]
MVQDSADSNDRSAGSRIAVIQKAVNAMDALLAAGDGLTPTEVADAIDTNRSTAFRLLTSLEYAGMLSRDESTGKYHLGMKLLQYGSAVRASMAIVKIAEPTLMTLRDKTRQTALLAVRENWGARCLLRLPGPEVDVVSWTTGQWLPMHVGAAPQALMSAMSDTEVERYLADNKDWSTRQGERSPDDVRDSLQEIRRRGWALNMESITKGVASLGTIVRDRHDAPLCAISVSGLQYHYTGTDLEQTAASVMAAASDISRRMQD